MSQYYQIPDDSQVIAFFGRADDQEFRDTLAQYRFRGLHLSGWSYGGFHGPLHSVSFGSPTWRSCYGQEWGKAMSCMRAAIDEARSVQSDEEYAGTLVERDAEAFAFL